MDKSEIEKFERHIGKGKEIKLKTVEGNEDSFYFEPLGVEFLPEFMKLADTIKMDKEDEAKLKQLQVSLKTRRITKAQFDEQAEELNSKYGNVMLKGDNPKIIVDLIDKMVKNSYPDLDGDIRNKFIFNNLFALFEVLMELNESFTGIGEEKLNKVEELRSRILSGQNDKT